MDDLHVPACRVCGDDLTNASELMDDTCTHCFQMRRYGRVLTPEDMGRPDLPGIDRIDLSLSERERKARAA